jgi:phosphatidylinositol alpha 1,6-mannosyltransferase
VRAEIAGARLAIVGDGPARTRLESHAGPGVAFLGQLSGVALAEVYASADVFCFPSTTDTFGQVLLEAGAAGLPVVAAAVGGACEPVEHGVNGLLVPPDDARALAAAVVELARSERLRRRLGTAGRRQARARTWERSLDELRQAYREVVSEVGEPARQRVAA